MKCSLEMPSYTYAVKAEKLLKARGYPCEIKRTEQPEGRSCGFSLIIRSHCREAAAVLRRYSVPFSAVSGEEHDNAY